MKARDYLKIITELAQLINEGIHIVDEKGITVFYSVKMAELEQVRREEILGKPYREMFSHIPASESTLSIALKRKKATYNKEQSYLNKYGKQVTTVNSTVPIIIDGKIAGAVEVANDITDIKSMTDTIMDLQLKEYNDNSRYVPKINRYTFADLIGENKEFRRQISLAKKAANSRASVFIYGETGTGKELFAQSIHYGGRRAGKPFLAQNCAALPESLLEGILFGTSKGGFTGAEDRAGLFEQANGGTLLLDEVSAMPYELQSKLLRVLQEGYIRRVGGTKDIPIDVRIIAAVNEPINQLIEGDILRKDLYYRLNIINLNLPPLRERRDDIELLAYALLEKHRDKMGKYVPGFEKNALGKLYEYDFPGNVRELENAIMSAVALGEEDEFLTEDSLLLNSMNETGKPSQNSYNPVDESMDAFLEKTEKAIIEEAMLARQGNISQAAEYLGIKRQTLQHKLKKYGL